MGFEWTTEHLFFYPLAALAVGCALGVVFAKNPLYSALWLVSSFFFLAAIFFMLGAHLVGVLQVMVYAGAIMVLFLFVIMLLAITDADLGRPRVTWMKILGGVFCAVLLVFLLRAFGLQRGTSAPLVMWMDLPRRAVSGDFGTVAAIGRLLFNEYLLQFEATSLLLLAAITGAVVVAKGKI